MHPASPDVHAFFAALIFAQRARCASAILFLPAADILGVGRAALFRADLVVAFNGGSYGEFRKWYRWELQSARGCRRQNSLHRSCEIHDILSRETAGRSVHARPFVSHGKYCSQTRESGLPSTCSTSLTLPSRWPVAPLRSSMVMLVSTRGANSSMRR